MSQMQSANTSAVETSLEAIAGLIPQGFDYVSVAYPNATTEEYTFKTGGSGGTTIATVTVVYTDSTKDAISTVTSV